MRPSPFAYSRPQHLAAALAETALGAVPLAGGQSLIPAMRQREAAPAALVDLNHIAELPAALEWTAHSLRIGARVTHAQLLADATVAARLPWLTQAVRALGDVQVRQRGTPVGNVCWADPRANLLVALLAGEAVVQLQGPADAAPRQLALADFITGFRRTAVGAASVIALEVPLRFSQGAYLEFSRQRQDLALVNLCVVRGAGSARVVLGGLDQRPLRLPAAEALLAARPLTVGLDESELAALFTGLALDPPPDAHAPLAYRLQIAHELLRRALIDLTGSRTHG